MAMLARALGIEVDAHAFQLRSGSRVAFRGTARRFFGRIGLAPEALGTKV